MIVSVAKTQCGQCVNAVTPSVCTKAAIRNTIVISIRESCFDKVDNAIAVGIYVYEVLQRVAIAVILRIAFRSSVVVRICAGSGDWRSGCSGIRVVYIKQSVAI